MRAKAGALTSTLLMSALLTACASSTEDYCNALEDQEQALIDLADGGDTPQTDLFGESLTIFEDLREQAPDDIVDEWDTFLFAWEGVAEAFEQAGADPQDYDPDDSSNGLSQEDTQAIEDSARELGSPRVVEAGDGIEAHARDVCKVDLGL